MTTTLPNLLDVEQLAELLHRSPHTIRLDACRAPHRLPPLCRLPGHNRLLWRREDVSAWIDAAVTSLAAAAPAAGVSPHPPRRRGRPTKAMTLARQRAGRGQPA